MSASESAATVAPVEVQHTETPVDKVEDPAAVVTEAVTPAVEVEAAAEPTEVPAMSESKADDVPKVDVPKSSFLAKLQGLSLNPFKGGEKKTKAPKNPKKEKKEEVEATATAEAPKEASAPEVPVEAVETAEAAVVEPAPADVPAVVTDEVKETTTKETPVMPKADVKAMKVGRRLSSRVGDFFKSKPKTEVTTPAKVDEHPPMITAPEAIAPLENPATEAAKVEEPKVEASAPVVAATA